MTDQRSPAHRLAQALLDQDVRVAPSFWTAEHEAKYGAALEASGLPEALREVRAELVGSDGRPAISAPWCARAIAKIDAAGVLRGEEKPR